MIALSLLLKPQLTKIINIVFAIVYGTMSVMILVSDVGNAWQGFYVLYQLVELVVFGVIIWLAWKWPDHEDSTD